jgi:hypothetical protein
LIIFIRRRKRSQHSSEEVIELQQDLPTDSSEFSDAGAFISEYGFSDLENIDHSNDDDNDNDDGRAFESIDENIGSDEAGDSMLVSEYGINDGTADGVPKGSREEEFVGDADEAGIEISDDDNTDFHSNGSLSNSDEESGLNEDPEERS